MAGHLEDRGKDKQGRYRVRWRYRSPGDPPRFMSKTFHSKSKREAERLARAWGSDQETRVADDKWQDPRDERLFSAVVDEWRESWPGLEPRTKNGYHHILALHVLPAFGDLKIGGVGVAQIERWLTDLGATRSRATVHRIYGVLRRVMKLAKRRGYIDENPCLNVEMPKGRKQTVARQRQLFLTPDEVRAVASEIDEHWRVAVYVAAWCGLRAGELWGLRVRDIDLLRGTLTVAQALKETNGAPVDAAWLSDEERGLYLGAPKTTASRRTMLVPDPIKDLLAEQLSRPRPGGNDPDALVFTAVEGGPVRHSLFYSRYWMKAVRVVFPAGHPKAGLRWHDLRHTCAALTLSVAGGDLYIVKERLGHENIQTTINLYAHLLPNTEGRLNSRLADLFYVDEASGNVTPLRQEGLVR